MNDIDFDDLTVDQKAALTQEQVDQYIRVYAMEQGVPLTTNELEDFTEETPIVLPTETFYAVTHEEPSGHSMGIVFRNHADAAAFLKLDFLFVQSKYLAGYHRTQEYVTPGSQANIVDKNLPSDIEVTRQMGELERQAQIQKGNQELSNQRKNRDREIERLSEYIWGFVREARARVYKLDDIRSCWAEYQDLAKDFPSAVKFMLKAYDDTTLVAEALGATWNCVPEEASPA
tara:strand:- start:26332 stop:27024 length:693 start_codon:yes stop_codon:yes gene_type:complete